MPSELCKDQTILPIVNIVQKILLLIQIIVPILLITWGTISFIKLVKNPEEKNSTKKIINQFLAAAIVFFIPMTINVVMNMLGSNTNFSSCWQSATNYKVPKNSFMDVNNNDRKNIISNAEDYDTGNGANGECIKKGHTTNILFVGNSKTYVHNIPEKVKAIAKSNGYDINVVSVIEGGNTLQQLYTKYQSKMTNASYDCLILQEQTDVYQSNYNEYRTGAKNIITIVRNRNPNIGVYIRALWITSSAGTNSRQNSYQSTEKIAIETNSKVIYDGKAFDQSRAMYPNINLFDDNIHQSEKGAYLSAATIYKTISNSSLESTTYTASLSKEEADKLLKIAESIQ